MRLNADCHNKVALPALLLPEKWFPPSQLGVEVYPVVLETRKIEPETVPPDRLVQDAPGVVVGVHLLCKIVGVICPAKIRFSELEFFWNTCICEQLLICGLLILCPERLEEKGTAKQEKK